MIQLHLRLWKLQQRGLQRARHHRAARHAAWKIPRGVIWLELWFVKASGEAQRDSDYKRGAKLRQKTRCHLKVDSPDWENSFLQFEKHKSVKIFFSFTCR